MFSEARVGMCILDEQGTFVETNREYEQLLGYPAAELKGTHFADYTHPDDAPSDPSQWADAYAGGAFRTEKRYLRKDGTTLWVDLRSSQIPNPAGGWFAFVVAADITERKRLEAQLRQAEKMDAIGSLAVGIAHDFNNLLTVITGHCALLLPRLGDEEARHDALEIERAAANASQLTRQLLAFSSRRLLRPEVIDLNELVAHTLSLLDRLIGEEIELVRRLDPGLGRVLADRGHLTQVVLNLAVNARDAISGAGRLIVRTQNVEISQNDSVHYPDVSPGSYALLEVSDTGAGMDEVTLSRIFDPFFTTKEGGTGLGLATVAGIVEQRGGHIRAYSSPGVGTRFEILIPRTAQCATRVATGEPAPAGSQVSRSKVPETIVVVEDDEQLRRLVGRVLKAYGYRVLLASSAAAALELVREHDAQVDLLFADLVMPGMSGRALADRLCDTSPQLKVLLTSGYSDDVLLRHGVAAGGSAFIEKPYVPVQLALKIRDVLDS
jgi:PAS domain S-box-containing protein